MSKYRTIVADPPWQITDSGPHSLSMAGEWAERHVGSVSRVPYEMMSVEAISALPVPAADSAHLYLWTTNAYVEAAYDVARAWGFKPSTLLTWCKAPRGLGFGGAHCITTEFVLFARRGSLAAQARTDTTWWNWKRPYVNGVAAHSTKPDGFLDMVEVVSPGPYLEMFARRSRLGWDYWGDESLGTAEMPEAV